LRAEPDAVSVCSPNGAHEENTIAALQAGAHVIVEKPTLSPAEDGLMVQKMLDAIYESSSKGGREVMIRQNPGLKLETCPF